MSKADYYAKLHDLLIDPSGAAVITLDDQTWITDRYVLLDAGQCGVLPALNGLADGWYAIRRSSPPRKTGLWGMDEPEGDIELARTAIAKLKASFTEKWSDWVELTPTSWAVIATDKDGETQHARVLLDPDRRPTVIHSQWLGCWSKHMGPVHLEQPKGEPRRPIKVLSTSSYTDAATYKLVTNWSVAAWLMPVNKPELPDELNLPTVG